MTRHVLLNIMLLAAIRISTSFHQITRWLWLSMVESYLNLRTRMLWILAMELCLRGQRCSDLQWCLSWSIRCWRRQPWGTQSRYKSGWAKLYTCHPTTVMLNNTCRVCGSDLRAYGRRNLHDRSLLIQQQNANFVNDYFKDRTELLRIYVRCQWLVYQHSNFEGQSFILNPGRYHSASKWGERGNHITLARALTSSRHKSNSPLQHSNYKGHMLVLSGSNSNLPAIDLNNQLSSFIITGGHWTLFEHIPAIEVNVPLLDLGST